MALQLTTLMLGVADLDRAKGFYRQAFDAEIEKEFPGFAELRIGGGTTSLALYPWDGAAADAGVPADGSGFRGTSMHVIVSSSEEVDAVVTTALDAGATIVRKPQAAEYGGYFGYFADPDGHLWKVASG